MDRQKLLRVSLLSLAALLLALMVRNAIPALETLELAALDWRFRLRGEQPLNDLPIVLVTIDDYSFEALPDRWPWPRSYYANVIENLEKAGARVIGLDVIFDKPDKYGLSKDQQLADAIRNSGRIVLAKKLEQDYRLQSYFYFVDPIPVLKDAAGTGLGLVSVQSDPDGIYRRYPAAQHYQGEYYPSFVLELLRKYRGYGPEVSVEIGSQGFTFGEFFIPHFAAGHMLINYRGPAGTFPHYSFASVLDDASVTLADGYDFDYFSENLLPDGVFKDKIVIVGSTAADLHDNFPTPFLGTGSAAKETPGMEILANATHTILGNLYFYKPPRWLSLGIVLLLVLLVQMISLRLSPLWSTLITLGLILLLGLVQILLFSRAGIVMEMVFPALALAFSFVSTNLYQFMLARKEKQRILGAFAHYVPAKVVQELIAHPEKLALGGEERVMTVLFSDVASFTTISESLTPRQLVMLINEYLSEMTELILKYDGIIDKYEGDAIMAEFGAPVYYDHHATNACHAALEMQHRLKELSRIWRRQGRPVLSCRVGINTGNMIVGNMGSRKVFDYTVLGDEVNLASRLEGANKLYGTRNMISEATYQQVRSQFITRPLDLIVVKGKRKPVQVYELIARKDEQLHHLLASILPMYEEGMAYYEARNWEKAADRFSSILRLMPDDGPSKLYLRRSQEFALSPPPLDWDGVYQMQSK